MKKIVRAVFEKFCKPTTTNYYGSDSMGPGDGVTGPTAARKMSFNKVCARARMLKC